MKAPDFWYNKNISRQDWRMRLLSPLARLVAQETQKRLASPPSYVSSLPVICVGNITLGGSGKTPVVQSLAHLLQEKNKRPVILLRGYGGTQKAPLLVNPDKHHAHRVGDEALLHARYFPTVVARDRAEGARFIEKKLQADIILMDDGFQNPALEKSLSLVVVDGVRGWGNGMVLPAGPLREPVEEGLKRTDALVIMGEEQYQVEHDRRLSIPVFKAFFQPDEAIIADLIERPVIAFAGIGHPDKFFTMLRTNGVSLLETFSFSDHKPYSSRELKKMLDQARKSQAVLVTTQKDYIRLPKEWRKNITPVDGHTVWQNKDALLSFLKKEKLI